MPYFPPPQSSNFAAYGSAGLLSGVTKVWRGEVTANGNGDFAVDYSSAGFTSPPIVSVTAESADTGTVRDRAWATLRGTPTATGCNGYALRGQLIVTILIGGAVTVRTAPGTVIHVTAIGS